MILFGRALSQQGPPTGAASIRDFWILIPLLLAILVIFIIYWRLLPNLTKVKPVQDINPQIESEFKNQTLESPNLGTGLETVDEKNSKKNEEILYKAQVDAAIQVLSEDEKKIVEALLAAGGTMLQKEISWKTGYSRVKTHRVLLRLIRRSVVSAEKYYNTNRISLADWLQKGKPIERKSS